MCPGCSRKAAKPAEPSAPAVTVSMRSRGGARVHMPPERGFWPGIGRAVAWNGSRGTSKSLRREWYPWIRSVGQ